MKKSKVVIIGGGPAGLTAAYKILKENKNYNVVLLESESSLGGISKTISYKGNRMDLGGHRFFTKSTEVMNFWHEVMPVQGKDSFDDKRLKKHKNLNEGGPDPEKEDNVMLVRNRISRIYYLKKFFDYPISMKWQTFKNMGFVRTMSSGFSYLKSIFIKKKEDNLENFFINRFGKKLYSMFFEGYTEKLWGRHPRVISANWGAQRVKGLSITAVFKDMFTKLFHIKSKHVETSLIEEYLYPKYGPGQLWERVGFLIQDNGGKILLNHRVSKIEVEDKKIKSVSCLVDGKMKKIKGDIFISSMPLKDLVNSIDGNVPKKINKIANGLPYRSFVTVGLLVDKLKLRNETDVKTINNIIPDCWIYVQDTNVKLGRIQVFNNWSPYMVKDIDNTIWIGLEYFCDEDDDFWNLDDSDMKKMAIDELISMDVIESDANVLDYHREKVRKAYPAYFDTYSEIDSLVKYLNKYDNLYCIGRNGQHRYNNMDHSMMTAFEAVNGIVTGKKDKSNIWNVNVEKEYHEESKN